LHLSKCKDAFFFIINQQELRSLPQNIKSTRMKNNSNRGFLLAFFLFQLIYTEGTLAQTNNESTFVVGDALPDAPELAARGTYKVGVQTLDLVHKGQINVLKSADGVDPLYDRPLKVEVWYPAILPDGVKESVTYDEVLGMSSDKKRPLIPFTYNGRALRNAPPQVGEKPFPLVIVSHGYPGTRFFLSYLTENLASKGYVVVAIDHTESTFRDAAGFQSTLLNRSKDILFIINQMAELSTPLPISSGSAISKNFLSGLVDANNTGLIGYSMGGYGVLNASGAGYSAKLDSSFTLMTEGSKALKVRTTNNPDFKASYDARIKAVVAFAPWGMQRGVWDAEGLQGLKVPTFFVAGNQDDVSGYENGIKAIYNGAVNADRYMLTYMNARHNVAPNPPPAESMKAGLPIEEYYRYAEPAWNERRINNINQHFVSVFLGIQLQKKDYGKFLEVQTNSNDKLWMGFKPRSSVGLELLHAEAAK
jgi:predicted dienelactone hydrolase